ncbi:heparinase II/III domain-containing protein [Jiangella mangrovi]|uniref:Heparinase II/III-like C-terminal domain-containing protein n=1 Tax=Jiangella mangrovi TaxID=1524084 RepID=A0A7W9GR96_9ACTN|nr:heparinase II/III family protein [Jiangella mangrovi]MBB5788570.1 hypothetical protein [Jiangella mangrovi]
MHLGLREGRRRAAVLAAGSALVMTMLAGWTAGGAASAPAPGPAATAVTTAATTATASTAAGPAGPSVLFGPEDLPAIRAKTESGPGLVWWTEIERRADLALTKVVAQTCERDLRYDIADLAFAYLVTEDVTYARKAREIHLGVGTAPQWHPDVTAAPCAKPIWGDYGWRWPQMLAQTALSWDWISGSGVLSAADEEVIRQDLLRGGRLIHDSQVAPPYGGAEAIRNIINYRLRNVAGLGIVGHVLAGTDEGDAWAAYAWDDLFGDTGRDVTQYLHQMISPDGVYKEGQAYYQDSFRLLIPFFVAEQRATGRDAFADPVVAGVFESEALMIMPDGDPPTVDTGWKPAAYSGGFGHWVAGQYPEKPWLTWAWQRQEDPVLGRPTPAGDQWYALAFYRPDLEVTAAPPAGSPTRVLEDAGYGMLRGGWGPDDLYVFQNAEHVPSLSAHEQPDQTAFSLFAKGAYLAVDPGDGRNCPGSEHYWVRSADAHNLVLVDGAGPRQVSSYVEATDPARFDRVVDTAGLDYLRTRMTYGASGTDITRRTMTVGDEYVVVLDDLAADEPHAYDWRLHFGDLATGTLTQDGAGSAVWRTRNEAGEAVELVVDITAGAPLTVAEATGPMNYDPGSCRRHAYLRAQTQAEDTGYTAVLYPRTDAEAAPSIGHVTEGAARATTIALPGRDDVVVTAPGDRPVRLAGVRTDATHAVVSGIDAPRSYLVEQGRQLFAGRTPLLLANRPVDLVLSFDDGVITGRVDVARTTDLTLGTGAGRVTEVRLDGEPVPFTATTGRVELTVDHGGDLAMTVAQP